MASPSGTLAAPGPVYDNTLRLLAANDPNTVLTRLDVPAGPGPGLVRVSEALPASARYVDLITEIGPGRLAHVEFVRRPRADMPRRMLEYYTRILNLHEPDLLSQHVVVLARGTVPPEYVRPPYLAFSFHVVYLRDKDPDTLLDHPSAAPMAVLARARDLRERADLLRRSLTVVGTEPDPARRHDLTRIAVTLAGIHLDPDTITTITKETAMPLDLDEDTVAGRIIAARGEARGEARGKAQMYAALMTRTFGYDPRIDTLAERLATLPRDQALDIALKATTIDEVHTLTEWLADPGPATDA